MNPKIYPILSLLLAIFSATALFASDAKPAVIQWSATDLSGATIKVPASDRPSVLVFARAEQQQSVDALAQVKSAVAKTGAQVIVIFSGESAAAQGQAFAAGKEFPGWAVVADPAFAASGEMSVHVWPTTRIITADGRAIAHLAGVPPSYPADLANYLFFAAGAIDEPTLNERLKTRQTVTDGNEQKAARHLQVARRLLDAGDIAAARAEVEAGLQLDPASTDLWLAMASVLLAQGKPAEAIEQLSHISEGAAPKWEVSVLKAWALVALDRWDEAKALLPDTLGLNPNPAEAHYLAGLIYQHDQDWQRAAEAFRKAYESGADGKKLLTRRAPGATKP